MIDWFSEIFGILILSLMFICLSLVLIVVIVFICAMAYGLLKSAIQRAKRAGKTTYIKWIKTATIEELATVMIKVEPFCLRCVDGTGFSISENGVEMAINHNKQILCSEVEKDPKKEIIDQIKSTPCYHRKESII